MSYKLDTTLSRVSATNVVVTYSDLDSNPITNSRVQAINLEAIKQSLDNLFTTEQYERPFRPEYYSPLADFVGELDTVAAKNELFASVYNTVYKYEPRVVFLPEQSTIEAFDDGHGYELNFVFNVVGIANVYYTYSANLYTTIT